MMSQGRGAREVTGETEPVRRRHPSGRGVLMFLSLALVVSCVSFLAFGGGDQQTRTAKHPIVLTDRAGSVSDVLL